MYEFKLQRLKNMLSKSLKLHQLLQPQWLSRIANHQQVRLDLSIVAKMH